jgi:phage/plasmid-like protein (TIGR03299 family)
MSEVRNVNDQFNAERVAQMERVTDRLAYLEGEVALGNMRKRDDGRFEVLGNGWDRGEIFGANGMPVSGLDTLSNGKTAFYSKDLPAWHALGTVVPGGLHTAAEVLMAGGLAYTVAQKPVTFTPEGSAELITVPGSFVNYRTDNGQPLGVVGKLYTPVQPIQAYGMLDELLNYGMVAETAGSFKDGARMFITAKMPTPAVIDPDGIADEIEQYIALINSHDGSTPSMVLVTPWRILCANTARFAIAGAQTKWAIRHTTNVASRMSEAATSLGLTQSYYSAFAAEETALVQAEFNGKMLDKLITQLWTPVKDEDNKTAATKHAKRRAIIHEIWGMESERVGKNAFAAENAVTGYIDHYSELRPRSAALKGNRLAALGDAVMSESMDAIKDRTHTRLMTLTNR